ncbi:MAG: DUF4982 domain-containing protein [Planctomycetes bacterium]|nr:DUF4982 domain-containing protein [Planctomycetota bacterium]
MKTRPRLRLLCALLLLASPRGSGAAPDDARTRLFDDDWRFLRGEAVGAEAADFDDAPWRPVDLPHDASIEDLPPATEPSQPRLLVAAGVWRFRKGDDARWREPALDDSDWQEVRLPAYWENHSDYTDRDAYGWYRRRIAVPEAMRGKDILIDLGKVDDVDETFVNGTKVGGSGAFPPDYRSAWTQSRRYTVPAGLLRGDGTDVVAVRVFDGDGNGGLYAEGTPTFRSGPFDAESEGGASSGFTIGGVAWYRKRFTLPENARGRRIRVLFDGVYMDARIWLNGVLVGEHPYGYTSFHLDLTPSARFGKEANVLAVRIDASGRHTRWYSGSGICRHAWLTVTDPVHVAPWGICVTTPEATPARAMVRARTTVANDGAGEREVRVAARIIDPDGREVASQASAHSIAAGATHEFDRTLAVPGPALWSPDSPALYRLVATVAVDGATVDEAETTFGIRTIAFGPETGFVLNGKPLELRGGCVHHDNGCLGACAFDRAESRRVELLKASGFNAIRTSHNPPSPAFLEACDRLGVLVVDEAFDCFTPGKNPQDYGRFFDEWWKRDIESMVLRDRNHPSVIIWSIGNEVPSQATAEGARQTRMLAEYVRPLDPTRPVTQAFMPVGNWDDLFGAFDALDVVGYNYKEDRYRPDHEKRPRQIIFSSESLPKDLFRHWRSTIELSYVFGDFVWTAMDYLGEAGIGEAYIEGRGGTGLRWPWTVSNCGDLDLCGWKRPQSYYRDMVWDCGAKIACFVHRPLADGEKEALSWWGWPDVSESWTWPGEEGKPLDVHVYSVCPRARLSLNGRDLGAKDLGDAAQLQAVWRVPYEAGTLTAHGLDAGGNEIARWELRTAGPAARIRMTADRTILAADGQDLAFVSVEILDAKGILQPEADGLVRFRIDGPGSLAGAGNADPKSHESFQQPRRRAYRGRLLAVVRAGKREGTVRLAAEGDGLEPAAIDIAVGAGGASAGLSADPTVRVIVGADRPGARIRPTMVGIFFEDINFGADGGLYPERVKNRSFEFPEPLMGWKEVRRDGARGSLAVLEASPRRDANPHHLRITVEAPGAGFGIANEGFRGMGLREGAAYRFSALGRIAAGAPARHGGEGASRTDRRGARRPRPRRGVALPGGDVEGTSERPAPRSRPALGRPRARIRPLPGGLHRGGTIPLDALSMEGHDRRHRRAARPHQPVERRVQALTHAGLLPILRPRLLRILPPLRGSRRRTDADPELRHGLSVQLGRAGPAR